MNKLPSKEAVNRVLELRKRPTKVSASAQALWLKIATRLRKEDDEQLKNLSEFDVRELDPTVGASTYSLPKAVGTDKPRTLIVFNKTVEEFADVVQAGLLAHESRHVRQIENGSSKPTVANEMDALLWEKGFLESQTLNHQCRERLKQISEQWNDLSTQDSDAEPSMVVKDRCHPDSWGMLWCGILKAKRE